jgi:hypothetical protein
MLLILKFKLIVPPLILLLNYVLLIQNLRCEMFFPTMMRGRGQFSCYLGHS